MFFLKEFLIKLNCGFSLDYITTILDSFCAGTKTKSDRERLFRRNFCSGAVPISKVESYISYRRPYYSVNMGLNYIEQLHDRVITSN